MNMMLINNPIKNEYDDYIGIHVYIFSTLKLSFTCYCTLDYMIMVNLIYA